MNIIERIDQTYFKPAKNSGLAEISLRIVDVKRELALSGNSREIGRILVSPSFLAFTATELMGCQGPEGHENSTYRFRFY